MNETGEMRKHLDALERAFFENIKYQGGDEWGYIGLDCKRPFGNSDLHGDILNIIGVSYDEWDGPTNEQIDYATNLWLKLAGHIRDKYGN